MDHKYISLQNIAIRGVVSCIPSKKVTNNDFLETFTQDEVLDVSKISGVKERRHTADSATTSDLCVKSAEELLSRLRWDRSTIDVVLFVSQTPDHRIPATSFLIQDRLELPKSTLVFDVNLGCSGYVYGLFLAGQLLQNKFFNRVLLLTGDTVTKFVNPKDRATAMLFGDAGTATAVEKIDVFPNSHFILGSDGSGGKNLIVPGGGFRKISDDFIKQISMADRGFQRSELDLYMNGGEIFNFTLKIVPSMIKSLLHQANLPSNSVHFYLLHQANEFMLKHLIKKAGIDPHKAPINISKFGNTSVASIPLLISSELENAIKQKKGYSCLAGFGVGYSWASALIDTSELSVIGLMEA